MQRRVLDGEDRRLRTSYAIDDWLKSDPEICERYFEEIDHMISFLRIDERDPPDAVVVRVLAILCEEDVSLDDHIWRQNASDPPWEELRKAAGAVLFEAYIQAREEEGWRPLQPSA